MDLKRWKKMRKMDFSTNPDYFLGAWVNVKAEVPNYLAAGFINKVKVQKLDGTIVTYNGTNGDDLVGFWVVEGARNRNSFGDEVYMAPIGINQITEYKEKGFTLTQTKNW